MVPRDKYLRELKAFQDTDVIKVVTGVRRSGKSTLLELMRDDLLAQGKDPADIFFYKMESMRFDGLRDYRELYGLVTEETKASRHPYLFFDELQDVEGWERAINSLRVDLDADIYITGSNAYLLSSELSTLISGRYVEVEMLPLTFSEYLDFRGYETFPKGSDRADLALRGGEVASLGALLSQYRLYGGFPYLALREPDRAAHSRYLKSLYDTVIVRDILERDRRGDRRRVTNPDLLRRVCAFLSDNVGSSNSVNSIAGAINSENMRVANSTVDAYIGALVEAYLFYPARRYDIKGKELLKTLGKHYVVDVGLRSYLEGYRGSDPGHVLENIVYLQLRYDGFDVSVGKLRSGEVDFVARKGDEITYIQVTEDMSDAGTMERELKPLRGIRDSYPKMVVVANGAYPTNMYGIRSVSAVDFLLGR